MVARLKILVLSVFLMGIYCDTAFSVGSGGFRNEVVDSEALAKGNSFVAEADAPSAVYYNPAGLTQLKGSYATLGYVLEAPRFECVSEATGDTVQMQPQNFLIPHLYYVSDFSLENLRFGFGAFSPYGLSTDWSNDSFSKYVMTESDLQMFNLSPCVAYKVNDNLSIGVGGDYFISHISKHKELTLTAMGGLSDTGGDFQLKGNDEGYGYNIGLLFKPSETQNIGISYRSEIDLVYRGIVTLDNLNALYTGIMGNSTYTTAMESKSTIPRSIAVGYAYKPSEKWTVEFDVEWTDWSCVESEMITYPDESNTTRLAVLNSGNPTSRDWNDVFSYGFGAEYKATDKLDLRFGGLYQETPVPSATLDTPLPDSDKYGLTIGLGYLLKKDVKIDAAYGFYKYRSRYVSNDVGASTGSNIDGTYKAYVNLVSVGFTYSY